MCVHPRDECLCIRIAVAASARHMAAVTTAHVRRASASPSRMHKRVRTGAEERVHQRPTPAELHPPTAPSPASPPPYCAPRHETDREPTDDGDGDDNDGPAPTRVSDRSVLFLSRLVVLYERCAERVATTAHRHEATALYVHPTLDLPPDVPWAKHAERSFAALAAELGLPTHVLAHRSIVGELPAMEHAHRQWHTALLQQWRVYHDAVLTRIPPRWRAQPDAAAMLNVMFSDVTFASALAPHRRPTRDALSVTPLDDAIRRLPTDIRVRLPLLSPGRMAFCAPASDPPTDTPGAARGRSTEAARRETIDVADWLGQAARCATAHAHRDWYRLVTMPIVHAAMRALTAAEHALLAVSCQWSPPPLHTHRSAEQRAQARRDSQRHFIDCYTTDITALLTAPQNWARFRALLATDQSDATHHAFATWGEWAQRRLVRLVGAYVTTTARRTTAELLIRALTATEAEWSVPHGTRGLSRRMAATWRDIGLQLRTAIDEHKHSHAESTAELNTAVVFAEDRAPIGDDPPEGAVLSPTNWRAVYATARALMHHEADNTVPDGAVATPTGAPDRSTSPHNATAAPLMLGARDAVHHWRCVTFALAFLTDLATARHECTTCLLKYMHHLETHLGGRSPNANTAQLLLDAWHRDIALMAPGTAGAPADWRSSHAERYLVEDAALCTQIRPGAAAVRTAAIDEVRRYMARVATIAQHLTTAATSASATPPLPMHCPASPGTSNDDPDAPASVWHSHPPPVLYERLWRAPVRQCIADVHARMRAPTRTASDMARASAFAELTRATVDRLQPLLVDNPGPSAAATAAHAPARVETVARTHATDSHSKPPSLLQLVEHTASVVRLLCLSELCIW